MQQPKQSPGNGQHSGGGTAIFIFGWYHFFRTKFVFLNLAKFRCRPLEQYVFLFSPPSPQALQAPLLRPLPLLPRSSDSSSSDNLRRQACTDKGKKEEGPNGHVICVHWRKVTCFRCGADCATLPSSSQCTCWARAAIFRFESSRAFET